MRRPYSWHFESVRGYFEGLYFGSGNGGRFGLGYDSFLGGGTAADERFLLD
jgi:hypothetical protein